MRRPSSCAFEIGILFLIVLLLVVAFAPPSQRRRRGSRSNSMNQIRQLVLAMHNYHDTHGHLPPAYIADNNGKPIHSWRVLILPYIEGQRLYEQYDFDEPWDGLNNIKLLDEMPDLFRMPNPNESKWWYKWFGARPVTSYTRFVAITGPNTAFHDDRTVSLPQFADGTSQTVCLTQLPDKQFHWTQPEDISASDWIDGLENLDDEEKRREYSAYSVVVALADGSVRMLQWNTTRETLEALTTIAGEDEPGDF